MGEGTSPTRAKFGFCLRPLDELKMQQIVALSWDYLRRKHEMLLQWHELVLGEPLPFARRDEL